MPVPASIEALDVTPASNSFAGTDQANTLDEAIRTCLAFTRQTVTAGSDIASASTITPASTASSFNVTGTTTITAIGSTNSWDGREITLRFTGALTLTHSSTLVLPYALNIVTASGDIAKFRQRTSGTWDCVAYLRVTPPSFSAFKTTPGGLGTGVIGSYTEEHDYGSNFNASTGVFTAPAPGVYLFTANVTTLGIANTRFGLDLRRNGSRVAYAGGEGATSGQPATAAISRIINLSAGDTIDLNVGFSINSVDPVTYGTTFSGRLMN